MDTSAIIEECLRALPHVTLATLEVEPYMETDRAPRADAVGTLAFAGGAHVEACFEVIGNPTSAAIKDRALQAKAIAAESGRTPILVAPFLSEGKRQLLRDCGMNFLDTAGNAWIVTQGVFVDRSGKKTPAKAARLARFLFSDKATLVIRLLFSGESLGVRQMSSKLTEDGFPLTPGYISKTVAALAQDRYAVKESSGKVHLASRSLLLEDWVAAYRFKARRQPTEGWYFPEADPRTLAESVGHVLAGAGALTDRSGAYFVDAHATFDTVDILSRDRSAVVEALRALGAEPAERGANINLHAPTYPVSSFFGVREVRGVPVVSDLQLYLDLRCQPKRGQEAAEHLYNRNLRPLLKGDRDDG